MSQVKYFLRQRQHKKIRNIHTTHDLVSVLPMHIHNKKGKQAFNSQV